MSTKPKAEIITFPKPTRPRRRHFRFQDPVTGESKEKTVYGKSDAEAEKKKQDFLRKIEAGLRPSGKTVAEWAGEWLEVYKKPYVSPNTYATYASDAALIIEAIGLRPLSSVIQADIMRLMATRRGLSASAIRKTLMTANAIFEAAIDNRLITINPCRGVKPPQGTTSTHRALSPEEVAWVMQRAREHRFGLPVMLMLFAGLRRGEAAGITAGDISDVIHVRRSVFWEGNTPRIKTPKTAAGTRKVPVFPPLKPFLDFTGYAAKPTGNRPGPISLQAFVRGFESFMGDKDIRCHDLRHSFTTMIYDAGVDVKTAQAWLGHADAAVTMRIYTHLSAARQEQATQAAEHYFSRLGCTPGDTPKTYHLKR